MDHELSSELKQLRSDVSNLTTAILILERNSEAKLAQILDAFPEGVSSHREEHNASLRAKRAQEEFYLDLKKEITSKGVLALIVLILGLFVAGGEFQIKGWLQGFFH